MEYFDAGFLPEALVNYLARLGWSHGNDEIFPVKQFVETRFKGTYIPAW